MKAAACSWRTLTYSTLRSSSSTSRNVAPTIPKTCRTPSALSSSTTARPPTTSPIRDLQSPVSLEVEGARPVDQRVTRAACSFRAPLRRRNLIHGGGSEGAVEAPFDLAAPARDRLFSLDQLDPAIVRRPQERDAGAVRDLGGAFEEAGAQALEPGDVGLEMLGVEAEMLEAVVRVGV